MVKYICVLHIIKGRTLMKRTNLFLLFLIFLVFVSGCSSTDIKVIQEENNQLKQKLVNVEFERDDLKTRLEQLDNMIYKGSKVPSIMYSVYEQKLRLVMSEVDLHIYFGSEAPIVNKIMPNTVVKVLDAGYIEGQELWLYVEMPVYDIPAYCKGWIKESDTTQLTEENKKLGYDSVTILEGINVYNCDEVENISVANVEVTTYEMQVRIKRAKNGYVYVSSAGGWYFWVKEKDIIYAYDMLKNNI
jgi:hypothetical protein